MDKRFKTILTIAGIAIAAYLAYRWYENRKGSSQGLGSNLGSVGYLVGGSTGPSSGLNYYAGATNVTVQQPLTSGGHPQQFVPGSQVILGQGDLIRPQPGAPASVQ